MPVIDTDALESLPVLMDYHLWADYVELLCLTHIDGALPKSYLVDRINERRDSGEANPAEPSNDDETYDYESLEETAAMPSAKVGKQERFIEDVFRHLEYRKGTFGDNYPFSFSSEGNTLLLDNKWTPLRFLYIFTLLAANSRYLQSSSAITDLFEVIAHKALTSYMPKGSHVYIFGANSYDPIKRYTGHLYAKIEKLARDLCNPVICKKTDFKPTNSGDGGLDLVAWAPFKDGTHGFLTVFGQCACTDAWIVKQHSSNLETWSSKIHFRVPPLNTVFVPYCYRSSDGEWYSDETIHMSVLVDRVRLLHLFADMPHEIPEYLLTLIESAVTERASLY